MNSKNPKNVERMIELSKASVEFSLDEPTVLAENQLGNSRWVYHEETDNLRKQFFLNFSNFHDLEKRQTLQEILLYAVTGGIGWADETNRISVTSLGCVRHYMASCQRIYDWWSANASDLSLASFGRDDIIRLCRGILQSNSGKDLKPLASTLKDTRATINMANRYYLQSNISDGFVYRITESLRRDIAEPLLKPHGINYAKWLTYDSHDCIPVDVGLTLFIEATEVIRSRETEILLALFKAYRHSPPQSGARNAILLSLEKYRDYQRTGSFSPNAPMKSQKAWMAFGKKFDEQGMTDVDVLPWLNFIEVTKHCRLVRSACTTLLHLVTGNRVHEVAGYQTNQWFKDDKGTWWYRSKEWKVNKGANADRSTDPIGAEAAYVLTQMSFFDPNDTRPLLGGSFLTGAMQLVRQRNALSAAAAWPEGKEKEPMCNKSLRNWFSAFYQSHLVQRHPLMGVKHPHSHPHEARNFWVDVALRWIDPKYCDLIGKIRENLRHASQTMVYSYTDGKRSQDIQKEAQDRYMLEILQRVAKRDPSDPWFGAAAKRIRNEITSIEIMSPEALAEFAETQSELYSRFIFWEWGVCAVRSGEEAKANCADSETGIPNLIATDRKMQPEVCMGCVHQMAHKGFKNRIERIGITCQQRGEALKKVNPFLADVLGFKPAKKAKVLLKEFTS
jgi:hypothetical protein